MGKQSRDEAAEGARHHRVWEGRHTARADDAFTQGDNDGVTYNLEAANRNAHSARTMEAYARGEIDDYDL